MKNFYTIPEFLSKIDKDPSVLDIFRIILFMICIFVLTILFITWVIAFIIWDFPSIWAWFRALLIFLIIFILNFKKWKY